jgi:hypothetical protein
MKTQIGVGVAVLSALAAEGKDFDRDELNAMLDKLAASPEPEVRSGRTAMCYSPASPRPEVFEYVCKKCGTHTVYPTNTLKMAYVLARYRDGAASLRALGLDITLDESPLCQRCHSAKELNIPTRGKIVKNALKFGFQVGEEVSIRRYGRKYCRVFPCSPDFWVEASRVSADGRALGDLVGIRHQPSLDGKVWGNYSAVTILPSRGDDPLGWVRVQVPMYSPYDDHSLSAGEWIPKSLVGNLSYDEKDEPSTSRRERIAWIINGKRTIAEFGDVDILQAFLKGEKVRRVDEDEEVPLKRDLPRLRELLGLVPAETGLARPM